MVFGRGGGFAGDFVRQARERGEIRIVGTGENRWPFVHVDDLADLYVLALAAEAGSLYFASAGPSIPVKEVALAAAHGARVESIPLEAARRALGPVAEALVLDQIISSRKAARELGWSPKSKPVLEELA
jgi:nucleoside-diphosphate-sugar epimerase